jgi:CubicO group peptidase (beta-lactamase class C family)
LRTLSAIFQTLCVFTICLTAAPAQIQSPRPSAAELKLTLDQAVPQWLAQYDVPSVAIGYIEDGKLVWTAVYGEQSPGVPATDKTLYNIASLTKPISAETILRLASKGKLSLDEPVSAYWVDHDVKDNPWSKLLTPRLCLSHQTGFPNWRYQTNDVLKFQWEPGTRTGYSGEGYEYVARFAEKKTGRSFEDLAAQYVFKPIGMKDTSFTPRDWYSGRLALPRGPKDRKEPQPRTTWSAADLVHTTVSDYSKFVISVMRNQKLTKQIAAERLIMTRDQVKPADEKKACALQKPDPANCKVSAGMGLGWEVEKHNDETIIDHDGSDWGFKSLAFFVPKRKMGVVIFTNGENGNKVIQEIVRVLYPDPVYVATL